MPRSHQVPSTIGGGTGPRDVFAFLTHPGTYKAAIILAVEAFHAHPTLIIHLYSSIRTTSNENDQAFVVTARAPHPAV